MNIKNWIIFVLFISACEKDNSVYFPDNNVVAHRGAWKKKHLPQNSIAALLRAIEIQCAGTEFDVWLTKDDSLVVVHGPEYEGRNVEKTTFATLSKKRLPNDEPLPTLRQFLLADTGYSPTKFFIEIKSSYSDTKTLHEIADRVTDLVNKLGMEDKVIYISFHLAVLQRIVQRFPYCHTQYLGGRLAPEILKAQGISGLNYDLDTFYQHLDWVTAAKKNNLVLNTWTINDERRFLWLINQKFNYIMTDDPELLFNVLSKTR